MEMTSAFTLNVRLDNIAIIHQKAGNPDEAADALRQAADTAWMIGQHDRAFVKCMAAHAMASANALNGSA